MVQNPPPPLCPGLLCQGRVQISLCKEVNAPGQVENKNAFPEGAAVLSTNQHHLLAISVSPLETTGPVCCL